MIWLRPEFAARLPRPWKEVADACAVQGLVRKEIPGRGRRTLRFELQGRGYFLKLHWGVGWGEIFKNLASGRLPVLGAGPEWRALQRLPKLGIETMRLEAYGREGWNPARQRSFVVTRELESTVSLERYCADWKQNPPEPRRKWRLIEKAGPMEQVGALWVQRSGLSLEEAEALLALTCFRASYPEPLRAAHIVAGAVVTGEGGRRP